MASGTPRIMNQDAKVCPEFMEVEIRQSCDRTGPIKAMSHVVPPMPGRIVVCSSFLILRGVIVFSLHFNTS